MVVAIPALAAAAIVIERGGLLFAGALLILGWICLDELYRMTARAHPAKLVGFVALFALMVAAHYGTRDQVLLIAVAALPASFLLTLVSPAGSIFGITVTLLGVWWVGLALAHAVLLRDLPHGGGILTDVVIGTFVGDSGAYLGGRTFGKRRLAPAISPNKTVEGLVIGIFCAIVGVWFASLYQPWFQKGDAILLAGKLLKEEIAAMGPVRLKDVEEVRSVHRISADTHASGLADGEHNRAWLRGPVRRRRTLSHGRRRHPHDRVGDWA